MKSGYIGGEGESKNPNLVCGWPLTLYCYCSLFFIAPTNPQYIAVDYTDTNTIELSWYPPLRNKECVANYTICYPPEVGVGKANDICIDTPAITDFQAQVRFSLTGLEPCTSYFVTVTPTTKSGQSGIPSPLEARTEDGLAGSPRDLIVENAAGGCLKLSWNEPLVNPFCVER